MPKGGGGGYRGSGGYRGGSSTKTNSGSSTKTSSAKPSGEREGSSKTDESSTGNSGSLQSTRGSYSGGGGGYSSGSTRSSEAIHTLGPSSKDCEKAHRELRACLEANDDRMSVCHWYLSEWKRCQQKRLQKQPGK